MFNYIFGKETNNGLLVALMYIKQQFDNPVWNFSEIEGQLDSISFIYLNVSNIYYNYFYLEKC